MIRIAVCDDERKQVETIVNLLEQNLSEYNVSVYEIDYYISGQEFLESKKLLDYDIVFLDINMPEINGLEVAKMLKLKKPDILLVFITAFMDYALDGYKLEAMRFLLKDMLEETLPECVEAVIRKLSLQAQKMNYGFIEGNKDILVDRILYIESQRHKLLFNVLEAKFVQYSLYGKLDDIEAELGIYGFLRIHKSFLVNTKYVQNIANYRVQLYDGRQLPVPREKFQEVKERYYEIRGDMI